MVDSPAAYFPIAIVEAKAAYRTAGEGMQQAKNYAEILGPDLSGRPLQPVGNPEQLAHRAAVYDPRRSPNRKHLGWKHRSEKAERGAIHPASEVLDLLPDLELSKSCGQVGVSHVKRRAKCVLGDRARSSFEEPRVRGQEVEARGDEFASRPKEVAPLGPRVVILVLELALGHELEPRDTVRFREKSPRMDAWNLPCGRFL